MKNIYKIAVLGDGGVGKTYDPTIEDSYRKQVVIDNEPCVLEILDTAGQEEYTSLRDQWIRVEQFCSQIEQVKEYEFSPIYLVGNKSDKQNERQVKYEEGIKKAKKLDCKFCETSAKLNTNVQTPFFSLVRIIREHHNTIDKSTPKKKKSKCALL